MRDLAVCCDVVKDLRELPQQGTVHSLWDMRVA